MTDALVTEMIFPVFVLTFRSYQPMSRRPQIVLKAVPSWTYENFCFLLVGVDLENPNALILNLLFDEEVSCSNVLGSWRDLGRL